MPKPFPKEKIVELSQFIYRGEKIQAVKLYRDRRRAAALLAGVAAAL